MIYPQHAEQRMQQRGISRVIVEYPLEYGCKTHDHHGGQIVWLDKRAKARLSRAGGEAVACKLGKHFNPYAVINADASVVTVGHRYRRIKRH